MCCPTVIFQVVTFDGSIFYADPVQASNIHTVKEI